MAYGIVKTYIFTDFGIEAVKSKRLTWQQLLDEKYKGIYYHLIVEDFNAREREKYKKLLQNDYILTTGKGLEEKIEEEAKEFKVKRHYVSNRQRDKKWFPKH